MTPESNCSISSAILGRRIYVIYIYNNQVTHILMALFGHHFESKNKNKNQTEDSIFILFSSFNNFFYLIQSMGKSNQELKYKRLKVGHACYVCRSKKIKVIHWLVSIFCSFLL